MQHAKRRGQLGEFLRARRDQLRPEDFGLPAGQRRRAPGLRREEAALLCGISPTWFTWIEQGRTTSVSVPTLRAQRLVAEFRGDTAQSKEDPVRQQLVQDLSDTSPEFAGAWRAQRVHSRDGGRRSFQHPRRGRCDYDQYTLRLAHPADLKLTVLVPPASRR